MKKTLVTIAKEDIKGGSPKVNNPKINPPKPSTPTK